MNEIIYYSDILGLFIAMIGYAALGFFIYYSNRSRLINQTISKFVWFIALWMLGDLFLILNTNPDWLPFLYRLPNLPGSFGIFYALYCAYAYPRSRDFKLWAKILLLIPAFFFAAIWVSTDLLLKGFPALNPDFLYLSHPAHGSLRIFYVLYETIYLLAAFSIPTYRWFKYSGLEKKYLFYMLIWATFSIPPILIFEQWLPLLGVSTLLSLPPNLMLIGFLPVAYAVLTYNAFKLTPQIAATQLLGSLGESVAVYDIKGTPLSPLTEAALPPREEIDKIIKTVIDRGSVKDQHTQIKGRPVIASARFFKEGGGIIIVFHEISELEILLEQESEIKRELSGILQKEKMLSETLTKIASAETLPTMDKIVLEAQTLFDHEPESLALINKMKAKAAERIRLLISIESDKAFLSQKTELAEKSNKAGIARELEIIALKEKIAAAKRLKQL
jgi:hypothetical protein